MKELLHIESTSYQLVQRFGNMVILSVLFLAGCIPVVTIGTSLTALYYGTVKSTRSEIGYPAKEFIKAYRMNLFKGTLLTVVLILWTAFLYTNRAYNVLFILTAGLTVFLFPVLSRFRMNVAGIVKLSFVMMVRYFHYTVLVLIGFGAAVFVQFMILPMMTVFFVPGLYCYLISFPVEKVMKNYMPKSTEGDTQWYFFDKKVEESLEEAKCCVQK